MPRLASSHAQGSSRQHLQIMFLPDLPVCGHDCHLAGPAILLCQYVLSMPMLYCYDAWLASDAARQWHTTVFSGCKSPLGVPKSVPTTCDYSFSFACQQAACMNGEMHNGIMGYWQICMIEFFIHQVCFCNSKVRAGSNTRVHLQRLPSQLETFKGSDFQRGILLHKQTLKHWNFFYCFFSIGCSCF